ncbi:MAG: LysR family transcriptional regulator [Xanthomonadales bacterium]|nr:LysR family transcriptional regulator [Gammaproteobacteria bacterium]MBT8052348.1 LysR family transcriptional regulator [Gammaproteobacteria bacterium]NND56542.1 LysR family transcriptional regulator [Xanthomonadales bacterium]NNK52559.1 LysR family transcriptional regulator [Xanthomonadales bacterium]
MNIKSIDLNLLVYLDVLLRTRNVTRAAESLGISQPAMSNGLRRLRTLFSDPLLVRTSDGMSPTERAEQLQPLVREIVASVEKAVEPDKGFDASNSERVFRISVSDYSESTLLPHLLRRIRSEAPNITLDILTPSDVSFEDVERGNVDLVINRFDALPQSFHQRTIWTDDFSCLISHNNPIRRDFSLENYLEASHVWVSKTGMGIGVGVEPGASEQLGWVDDALSKLGEKRRIRVFTRHYHSAMQLAELRDLIITLPTKAAKLMKDDPAVIILPPPFDIPKIELKMAWSPLLQANPAHRWLRRLFSEVAHDLL